MRWIGFEEGERERLSRELTIALETLFIALRIEEHRCLRRHDAEVRDARGKTRSLSDAQQSKIYVRVSVPKVRCEVQGCRLSWSEAQEKEGRK